MGASTAIIAAQATMAAASAYGQKKAGAAQENISKAESTLTHAQQEFEIARKAAVEAETYRRDLATSVATASARGGAGMARQFGSQAQSSYARDVEAINRAYNINDIQKQNKEAQAAALKSTTTMGAVTGLAKDILGASAWGYNAGVFGNKTLPVAPDSNLAGTQSGKFTPLG